MSVSVRAFRKVASGLDAFLEAAADGDETTALLPSIVTAAFAVAVGGGISLELAISASVWAHVSDLLLN